MLKLLGAALLVGGGLWAGLGAAGELFRRKRALEVWCGALALLEGELAFRLPAMPELLDTLAQRTEPPASQVFMAARQGLDRLGEDSLANIWHDALAQCPGGLLREDLEVLDRLGASLGRYGWEDQRQAAETVRRTLEGRALEARQDFGRKGKAYGTLGLALGAFLTILLL